MVPWGLNVKLSRIGAKHLRENVTLMQVDLSGME